MDMNTSDCTHVSQSKSTIKINVPKGLSCSSEKNPRQHMYRQLQLSEEV